MDGRFLACVAVRIGFDELERRHRAENRLMSLGGTARSRLKTAGAAALRLPVVTARELASEVEVSPQAALALVRALVETGILREATGRTAWRAFILSGSDQLTAVNSKVSPLYNARRSAR